MIGIRNPFRMRTAEHIESDVMFLKMFSPHVLSYLPNSCFDPGVLRIQSSPGAGKTSLLRLFTPEPLLNLCRARTSEENKDLYERLRGIGAVTSEGPAVLGVLLSCAHNYAKLEDLGLGKGNKERYFYALLNARLVLATIRAALTLEGLRYPEGLERISFVWPNDPGVSELSIHAGDGKSVNEWACSLERAVYSAIDSLSDRVSAVEGNQTFYVPGLLRPETVLFDGRPVADRILVMLDDVYKLSSGQRGGLLQSLADLRPPIPVWVAERLEALEPSDLFPSGATPGREFHEPLNLETALRSNRRLEPVLSNIADRRAQLASDTGVSSLEAWLCSESMTDQESDRLYSQAIEPLRTKVRKLAQRSPRYSDILLGMDMPDASPRQTALRLQSACISAERDARRHERMLIRDPISEDEFAPETESSIVHAAEVFLHHYYGTPYYFGMNRLANLSSSNIEQFLGLAGDLFEQMLSQSLLRRRGPLTPMQQQAIIQKAVNSKWSDMMRRVPFGSFARVFLDRFGAFASAETYQPNAPYAPGVTGIALSMADRDRLVKSSRPDYKMLSSVLTSCLAFNLLEAYPDRRQGRKSDRWLLLHLNRWLCVRYDLPLNYGRWRQKTLRELVAWLEGEPPVLIDSRGDLI